jgi:hypothetical protein
MYNYSYHGYQEYDGYNRYRWYVGLQVQKRELKPISQIPGAAILQSDPIYKAIQHVAKAVAASDVARTFPGSNVSPINPSKMGQDFVASCSANDAPRIAFIS